MFGVIGTVVALTFGAATSVAAAPSSLSDTSVATVTDGPVFNNPHGTAAEQQAIKQRILDLISGVPSGSYIRVALYHLDDLDLANALVTAHQNGVVVRVILDHESAEGSRAGYSTLYNELGNNTASTSWVKLCPQNNGCLGTGINHNKFWMFSQTRGTGTEIAYRVVVQSSSNMTPGSYTGLWNNAYTIVASPRAPQPGDSRNIYDAYRDYFDRLTDGDASRIIHSESFPPYKTYFFPKQTVGDTVVGILDNVTCVDPATAAHTVIRVGMFKFTRQAVADKIAEKVREGCDVAVTYTHLGADQWTTLHPSSGARPALSCYVKLSSRGLPKEYVHSKYLLINGNYAGVSGQQLVFTGSHNYTDGALWSNDEALLKIDSGSAYAQYLTNFDTLTSYASPGGNEDPTLCQGPPFDCKEAGATHDVQSATTGACGYFLPTGEHVANCDIAADGHHSVVFYRIDSASWQSVANYDGEGTCVDVNLDLPETSTVTFYACNYEDSTQLACGREVTASAQG